MSENDQKLSPSAIVVAAMLSSGVGGVGTNFFMGDYKVDQIQNQIDQIKMEDTELRESIKSLFAIQNECITNTKLIQYRLERQERRNER